MRNVAYFMDFELETENAVFFPRPETEILVEKALEFLAKYSKKGSACSVLDIGTGSGNIAISLTNYVPSSRIVAVDISDAVLRVAGANAAKYGVEDRIEFIKSDLFENIRNRKGDLFDLIISNPPYVSFGDFISLPEEVKNDPFIALYGGRGGLNFYRRIINEAHFFLNEEGSLLLEIGYNQAAAVKTILEKCGTFGDIETYKDYSGIERIVKASKITLIGRRAGFKGG